MNLRTNVHNTIESTLKYRQKKLSIEPQILKSENVLVTVMVHLYLNTNGKLRWEDNILHYLPPNSLGS